MSGLIRNTALIVDLYELTMAAGYFQHDYNPTVTFELFIRELPDSRNFLIAAGLEQAIEYATTLKFDDKEIAYLKSLPIMRKIKAEFFDYLADFRYTGDIFGVREGEIIFPPEPLLQIKAPLIEAQLLETFLLSTINFQTMIASKATRVVHAAKIDGKNREIMEFGSRRAHGPAASVMAARAAYIGGCAGTSNVLAGYRFGIPVYGTASHSWTLAFSNEQEAFQRYNEVFAEDTIYLIDTFDVIEGARRAVSTGNKFRGVRIDSGDLELDSKEVRKILDENGLTDTKIILSGDLNEYKIKSLIQNKTPVDSFGVGTQIATSSDAPNLSGVYKLVERQKDGKKIYRAKFSPEKMMLPGQKQVYRFENENGFYEYDLLALADSVKPEGSTALIQKWVENGKQIKPLPDVHSLQATALQNLKKLESGILNINMKYKYPVEISRDIETLLMQLQEEVA